MRDIIDGLTRIPSDAPMKELAPSWFPHAAGELLGDAFFLVYRPGRQRDGTWIFGE